MGCDEEYDIDKELTAYCEFMAEHFPAAKTRKIILYLPNHFAGPPRVVAGACVVDDRLTGLYVRADYRRHGYGRQLLSYVKDSESLLNVECSNELEPFYAKCGFVKTGTWPDGITMQWTLDDAGSE